MRSVGGAGNRNGEASGGASAVDAAWSERVEASVARMAEKVPRSPFVVHPADARTPGVGMVDWGGFPLRVGGCLPRSEALALLDWRGATGCEGRLRLQEEYVEWRVVRDADGVIRRVELTTELAERWRVLAAHAPEEALRIAATFSGEDPIVSEALFGSFDPFADDATPTRREAAFAAAALDPPGPWNNGDRALCCMVHRSNSLDAIVGLLFAAAFAFPFGDRPGRCLSARQTIPLLADAAIDGRGSDPLLVERLGRLAAEGRIVALDDPAGVFVVGVEHTRLRCPDGSVVPPEWFRFSRDAAQDGGPARHQRVELEVPADAGVRVGDLIDLPTEQPIAFGGQIADLMQLAVFLRVSAPGALEVEWRRCEAPDLATGAGCRDVREAWDEFAQSGEPQR